MDRRDFIGKAAMAAGGLLLSSAGFRLNAKTSKKMRIVLLTGSPRRSGNTNHLADQFTKGARAEYAESIGLGTRKYNIKNIDSNE